MAAQEAVKAQDKQAEVAKGLQSRHAAETAKLQAAEEQLGAAKRQLTVPRPVSAAASCSSVSSVNLDAANLEICAS